MTRSLEEHNVGFIPRLTSLAACRLPLLYHSVLKRILIMTQIKKTGTYFSVLDGIRGIAAILVLIRHTTIFFGVEYPESFLAVDLFFVLSGVVIANSYEQQLLNGLERRQFVWLRIIRIFPLYILGTLLGVAAVLGGRPFEGNMSSAIALSFVLLPYIASTALFPFNNVSWSLFFEIIANFSYALFVRFLTGPVLFLIMVGSAAGMAMIGVSCSDLDVGWNHKTFLGGFCRVGYSFFAGIVLYRRFANNKGDNGNFRFHNVFSIVVIAFLATLLMLMPSQKNRLLYELAVVLLVFPVVVYLAMLLRPTKALSKFFKFLGLVSYGLYTLHLPISALVRGVLLKFAGVSNSATYPSAPWFGFGFIFCMAFLSWLADKFYDEPIRNFLRKLYRKQEIGIISLGIKKSTEDLGQEKSVKIS